LPIIRNAQSLRSHYANEHDLRSIVSLFSFKLDIFRVAHSLR
jgi:hypothetical protein